MENIKAPRYRFNVISIKIPMVFFTTLLNTQDINEEIKEEIKKYLETNDNENMMTQNLWHAAKAVLRGKFIAIQSDLKKQETSQINMLTLHLKQLEREKQQQQKKTQS